RQARQPLLAVDDVARSLLLADDDRAEKVVRILGDLRPGMVRIELFEELVGEVVDELADLLLLPLVLTLVVVNRVLHSLEELAHRLRLAEDLPHCALVPLISLSSPSVSCSSARMSARISSRVRNSCGL